MPAPHPQSTQYLLSIEHPHMCLSLPAIAHIQIGGNIPKGTHSSRPTHEESVYTDLTTSDHPLLCWGSCWPIGSFCPKLWGEGVILNSCRTRLGFQSTLGPSKSREAICSTWHISPDLSLDTGVCLDHSCLLLLLPSASPLSSFLFLQFSSSLPSFIHLHNSFSSPFVFLFSLIFPCIPSCLVK